ncbi:MAG: hypothetical protein LBR80_13305 [Deltaproteobacteria bacterium]|jgi:hypothetical protein|nr:hypothetical protein [Deltaproteobacteria bacterium]
MYGLPAHQDTNRREIIASNNVSYCYSPEIVNLRGSDENIMIRKFNRPDKSFSGTELTAAIMCILTMTDVSVGL